MARRTALGFSLAQKTHTIRLGIINHRLALLLGIAPDFSLPEGDEYRLCRGGERTKESLSPPVLSTAAVGVSFPP